MAGAQLVKYSGIIDPDAPVARPCNTRPKISMEKLLDKAIDAYANVKGTLSHKIEDLSPYFWINNGANIPPIQPPNGKDIPTNPQSRLETSKQPCKPKGELVSCGYLEQFSKITCGPLMFVIE